EKGQPEWVAATEYPNDPGRRQQLSEERRQTHDNVCKAVDEVTRGEIARRVLAPDGARLLGALAGKHELGLIGFAQETWDVKPDQLADLFRQLRPPGQEQNEKPAGEGGAAGSRPTAYTDLRAPLEQALRRSGHDQGKVLGVVLLTDGQHNWGPSP